jgi:hypothetical protein
MDFGTAYRWFYRTPISIFSNLSLYIPRLMPFLGCSL